MQFIVWRQDHILEALQDGVTVAKFPVAVGRADAPTPEGVWQVALGTIPNDPDVFGILSTPTVCCMRLTHDMASLGHDASGG